MAQGWWVLSSSGTRWVGLVGLSSVIEQGSEDLCPRDSIHGSGFSGQHSVSHVKQGGARSRSGAVPVRLDPQASG